MESVDSEVAFVGEKRAVENGKSSGFGVRAGKRFKDGTEEMRRVAEIVMVLSAMSGMRGGRVPTEAEVELMAEARSKLVKICQDLAPKDLVVRDAVGTVIEHLGLNFKVKDQRLGFRGTRLSIKEKFFLTKTKMEESKKFSAPVSYTSQTLQPNVGAVSENRGPSQNVHMFLSDKPGNALLHSVGLPASPSLGHVSTAVSGLATHTSSYPRVEKTQFNSERGPNGTPYAPQAQANAPVNNPTVNAPTWSIQPHSTSSAKYPPENKMPNRNPPKFDGIADLGMPRTASQATGDQALKPFNTQTTCANLPGIHQPMQGMKSIQPSPNFNNHNEIAKIVQKLLQPTLPEHPTWNPPSREYMNKALTCQMCKLIVNEVETVILCDACEKGYHLKCLESINQKGIPRGEWHCMRCTTLSNGKPLPPKYGRVMRSITPPKAPSNPDGGQSTLEKKVGALDPKPNQEKITMIGSSGLRSLTGSGNMDGNDVEPSSDSKIRCTGEASENSIASSGKDRNLGMGTGNIPNNPTKTSDSVADNPSLGSLSEKVTQLTQISESPAQEERVMPESKLQPPAMSSNKNTNKNDHSQPSDTSQDFGPTEISNSAQVPMSSCPDNHMVEELEIIRGATDCTSSIDVKEIKQDITLAKRVGSSELNDGARNHIGLSSNGLQSVEWVGNILKVEDGKKFYGSCFIDGITYKVQDYALFCSIHEKLAPYKIQTMWEDIKNGLKWLIINQCYFPGDLPEAVGHPCAPETNEVYESNHESSVMAGVIQGPCEVLPPTKFKAHSERQSLLGTEANNGSPPVFLCKWFYDESKGYFQPVCG